MKKKTNFTIMTCLGCFLLMVFFWGSFVFTCMGMLAPLRPYDWGPQDGLSLQTDDDCACFIFFSCLISMFFLAISWICLIFGKSVFFQKPIIKFVYLFWFIVTLIRLIYVYPYFHG